MRKERQRNEEEETGGLGKLESSNCVLAVSNPDLEAHRAHRDSHSSCDVGRMRDAESNEGPKTPSSHGGDDDSEKDEDTNPDVVNLHTADSDFIHGHSGLMTDDFKSRHKNGIDDGKPDDGEEVAAEVGGFSDHVEADQELECVDVTEGKGNIVQPPADFLIASGCRVDISGFTPASLTRTNQGSMCSADREALWVQAEHENSHLEGYQHGEDPVLSKEELDAGRFEPQEPNSVADESNTVNERLNDNGRPPFFFQSESGGGQVEDEEVSSSPAGHRDPSTGVGTENRSDCRTAEAEQGEESAEERLSPDQGDQTAEIWRSECTCNTLDGGKGDAVRDNNYDGVKRTAASEEDGHRGWSKEDGETSTNVTSAACADPPASLALSRANPAPFLPPLGSMATRLPRLEAEREEEEVVGATAGDREGDREGRRRHQGELEERGEEERASTVATEEGKKEEEEDEFGVFMQAEGEPAWSEGSTTSASVPCESRESVALGNHAVSGESAHWTPGWTDGSFHQSDDTWTAFPQDSPDDGRDTVEQWWPTSAVEERRGRRSTHQNLAAVFAEAFPSLPGSPSRDPCDLSTVPTLTQLLRGRASPDQGLLDSFHDLNKMIGQRYKRANGVSRDLLRKTLHLERPQTESRPAPWTANRRLSPGLPSANQHAQSAAAKRRLSYDYNRNVVE